MSANDIAIPPSLVKLPWKNRLPIKAFYVPVRMLSLLFLIPYWSLYYSLMKKPLESWTVGQCMAVRALRWIAPLNAECGLSPESVSKINPPSKFRESSLIWLEPADEKLIRGLAKDDRVRPVRVPGYVWPRGKELSDDDAQEGFIVLFIHGGGYMMGNGTENFGELDIARKLLNKNSNIKRVLSVEYRLVGDECHPAQLLDGLAAYSYLLNTAKVSASRVILIGTCSGGHLSMMLLRYLYEEKVLPLPAALMLFAPVLDMVADFEIAQGLSTHRSNTSIDWLITSHYANVRFLGHHNPDMLLKSPAFASNRAPPGSYTGYPPTFLSVGDADLLVAEVEQLAKVMRNDDVDVVLDVQKDAVHHFLAIPFMPHDAAREDAIEKASEWVGSLEKRVTA